MVQHKVSLIFKMPITEVKVSYCWHTTDQTVWLKRHRARALTCSCIVCIDIVTSALTLRRIDQYNPVKTSLIKTTLWTAGPVSYTHNSSGKEPELWWSATIALYVCARVLRNKLRSDTWDLRKHHFQLRIFLLHFISLSPPIYLRFIVANFSSFREAVEKTQSKANGIALTHPALFSWRKNESGQAILMQMAERVGSLRLSDVVWLVVGRWWWEDGGVEDLVSQILKRGLFLRAVM